MSRPSAEEVYLGFAELLARRSTCARLHVGAVVTDESMLQVFGIGYNGNAAGLPNGCDSDVPGACGCLHAELNALLKASGVVPGKVLFTSVAPCVACAKAIINARVARVVYRLGYRSADGLFLLLDAGLRVEQLHPSGRVAIFERPPGAR